MGYYMAGMKGDYYRGYRGDPGFFSFLGNIAKTAAGFIPGVGGIVSKAVGAIIPSGAKTVPKLLPEVAGQAGKLATRAKQIVKAHPVLTAAGAAGTVGALAGAGVEALRGRAAAGGRRHRGMNPCNPRALRRALRRAYRFEKLAMKTIHLIHPKKKARFGGFKKRRRAA